MDKIGYIKLANEKGIEAVVKQAQKEERDKLKLLLFIVSDTRERNIIFKKLSKLENGNTRKRK